MVESSSQDPEVSTDELLQLIGHDARISIMWTLWDDFDYENYVTEEQSPISFQDLYEPSPSEDTGNFNYHLQKLNGVLIEKAEEGYVLTPRGYNIMKTLENYATFEYFTLDRRRLSTPCPFCNGTLEAGYNREQVHVSCRECGGLAGDGNINFVQLHAKGLQHLNFEEIIDLASLSLETRVRSSRYGFCWACNSELDRSLTGCPDHERGEDGTCLNCHERFAVTVDVSCPNCGIEGHGPVVEYALIDSTVRSFLRSEGTGPDQVGHWRARLAGFSAVSETVVDADPVVVHYTFTMEDDDIVIRIADGEVISVTPVE